MEFSFKISESEFRRGWHLERKASSRSSLKTGAFWILIMLGLLLLFRTLQTGGHLSGFPSRQAIARSVTVRPVSNTAPTPTNLQRVGPFLVIGGIWILIVGGMVPIRLRHLYRKDPRMQGQFTVNVTPETISTENSAGTMSKCTWNVYDYWCEGKDLIVLMFHSGSYSVLSLAGLTETQRGELRGILKLCAQEEVSPGQSTGEHRHGNLRRGKPNQSAKDADRLRDLRAGARQNDVTPR